MSCDGRHNKGGALDPGLEEQIGAALHERADRLEPAPGSRERLWRRLEEAHRVSPWERVGRKYGRRVLLTMCLLLCLSCATTFASANGADGGGWVSVSWGSPLFARSDFEEVEELAGKLSYTPKYRQELAGGWEFFDGHISYSQRLDENNRRMSYVYKELCLWYRQESSGQELYFVASNTGQSIATKPEDVVREIGGVRVVYEEQAYKFVPVDYELTEADRQAMEDGSLMISSGSSKLEEQLHKSVRWVQDGVCYLVYGWDLAAGQEELFAIAREFIGEQPENMQ